MILARTRTAALAALALILGLGAAEKTPSKPAAKPDPTAAIRGQVLGPASEKAPTGAPIAKAKVAVVVTDPQVTQRAGEVPQPGTGETGADGKFAIEGLPGKSFTVRVQAPGFAPFEAQDVGPGAALKVRLAPGQKLEGRVLDAAGAQARPRSDRGGPDARLARHAGGDAAAGGDRRRGTLRPDRPRTRRRGRRGQGGHLGPRRPGRGRRSAARRARAGGAAGRTPGGPGGGRRGQAHRGRQRARGGRRHRAHARDGAPAAQPHRRQGRLRLRRPAGRRQLSHQRHEEGVEPRQRRSLLHQGGHGQGGPGAAPGHLRRPARAPDRRRREPRSRAGGRDLSRRRRAAGRAATRTTSPRTRSQPRGTAASASPASPRGRPRWS